MTADQRAALPPMLSEIVDLDRRIADQAEVIARTRVVPIETGRVVRDFADRRSQLRAAAHGLYGSAPLGGRNGPGRPRSAVG